MEELRRIFAKESDKRFERGASHFGHERFEDSEEKSKTNQLMVDLQRETRQPHLATEADVELDTKTRKRMEGAAAADRAKYGESVSARVDDGPTSLTSFGTIAKPLVKAPEKFIDDALVHKGAEASKPCLSPVKMHTPVAAGGLLPAGTASTER